MAQRDLEELGVDECASLVRTAHVGRLVYSMEDGPTAIPVNYALAGDDVVVRVEHGTKQSLFSQPVAFEVDDVDGHAQAGWSVLVRGTAREVDLDDVPALLREVEGGPPRPWATGVHNVWVRITPTQITGRRLGRERASLP